ncbi:hypothetical protein [Nocardia sp. NPDC059239]
MPASAAEHAATEVLTNAGQFDLTNALDTATKLANTANRSGFDERIT